MWSPKPSAVLPRRNFQSLLFTDKVSISCVVFCSLRRISHTEQSKAFQLHHFQRLQNHMVRYSHSINPSSVVPIIVWVTFISLLLENIQHKNSRRKGLFISRFVDVLVCNLLTTKQTSTWQKATTFHWQQKTAKPTRTK